MLDMSPAARASGMRDVSVIHGLPPSLTATAGQVRQRGYNISASGRHATKKSRSHSQATLCLPCWQGEGAFGCRIGFKVGALKTETTIRKSFLIMEIRRFSRCFPEASGTVFAKE